MVRSLDDRVKLSVRDWLAIVGLAATNLSLVVGIGVTMWTKLAVIETETRHNHEAIIELKHRLDATRT